VKGVKPFVRPVGEGFGLRDGEELQVLVDRLRTFSA
jgi:hypothetical protein